MMVFTDGSYSNNPNMCGIGVVVLDGKKRYEYGVNTTQCKDNNITEICAIAYALQIVNESSALKNNKDKHLILITDSKYAVKKINEKLSGSDELEQQALDYIQYTLNHSNKTITIFQNNGHASNKTKLGYFNNLADQIANDYRFLGLVKYQDQMFRQSLKKGKGR